MAKRSVLQTQDRTIEIKTFKNDLLLTQIKPRTVNQNKVFKYYEEGKHLFLHGSAGTGKTFLSMWLGLNEVINTHYYKNLIIIRSAVEVRKIGYLPGAEDEKGQAYEDPYIGLCSELFNNEKAYNTLKKRELIDFRLTSFLRGITLEDSFIIIDEAENMAWNELFTVMTRMGKNTKVIICGDGLQTDFKYMDEREGFKNFKKVIENMEDFACIEFDFNDILRGKLVKEFIIESSRLGLS